MTDKDEWGPWIEHDGSGCPCVGRYVQTEREHIVIEWMGSSSAIIHGKMVWGIARGGGNWSWSTGFNKIIRYRIRKPRGLAILQEIAANPQRELETT